MDKLRINVGVLAIQGAFAEHAQKLRNSIKSLNESGKEILFNGEVVEIRTPEQINEQLDGLIIPGGESTTMTKFLKEEGFLEKLRAWIRTDGKFTWGTCAGLILLSNHVEGGEVAIGGLDITCSRNSFGRQADSFETSLHLTDSNLASVAKSDLYPGIFIRAPQIKSVDSPDVTVLCRLEQKYEGASISNAVAVRQSNLMACAFHPELTDNNSWHEYFLKQVVRNKTSETA